MDNVGVEKKKLLATKRTLLRQKSVQVKKRGVTFISVVVSVAKHKK